MSEYKRITLRREDKDEGEGDGDSKGNGNGNGNGNGDAYECFTKCPMRQWT